MEQLFIFNSVALWVVVLFNLLLTLSIITKVSHRNSKTVSTPLMPPHGPERGEPAPPFTAETLSGEEVSLDDFLGHTTLFIVFGPDCGDCVVSLPMYQKLGDATRRFGVRVFLVSDSNANLTRDVVEAADIFLPVLVAPRGTNTFIKDYNFLSVPGFCLIDENGVVTTSGHPHTWNLEWRSLLETWLGEKIGD